LAFGISMRRSLQNSQKSSDEMWNPVAVAVVSPFSKTPASRQSRLVDGVLNIRSTINAIRDLMFAHDYADLMANVLQRQTQIRSMGKRVPATVLLTSWSYAPFADLEAWSGPEHTREPASLLQPVVGSIPLAPVPGRSTLDSQVGVIWRRGMGIGSRRISRRGCSVDFWMCRFELAG
jgi:hypothetical protein